jgi:hypothetical protein
MSNSHTHTHTHTHRDELAFSSSSLDSSSVECCDSGVVGYKVSLALFCKFPVPLLPLGVEIPHMVDASPNRLLDLSLGEPGIELRNVS